MIIGSKHNLTKIQTDSIIAITDQTNNNIKGVYKIESLGIIIDDNLNWENVHHGICKKTL